MLRFYDNFSLICKVSEDKATNAIENWSLSTTLLFIIDASSRENRSEYPHKPYIATNYYLWRKFLILTVRQYLHSFYTVVSQIEAEKKSSQTDHMKTNFSIKWHFKVI